MRPNRLFVPQAALDEWVSSGIVAIDGETLTRVKDGVKFRVTTAVRFVAEVAGGGDKPNLVGKVKDTAQLGALGGEHVASSVILGDDAYDVIEGIVAEPIGKAAPPPEQGGGNDLDLLAKFLAGR